MEWVTDLSSLNEVNARLEEASEKLEEGNAFLEQENQIKAESAELEMRNRIYDRVREAVSGTLEKMSKTLASDAVPEEKLRRTAFLGVYVKRRSNMEILRAGEGFSESGRYGASSSAARSKRPRKSSRRSEADLPKAPASMRL